MQEITVRAYSGNDYVHEDEVIALVHERSHARCEILVKDLDEPDQPFGRIGLLIPLGLVADVAVSEDFFELTLELGEGEGGRSDVEERLTVAIDRLQRRE